MDEAKWVEQWPEDEKKLPRKIRICFTDPAEKKILTVNVFVMENTAAPTLDIADTQSTESRKP